MSHGSVVQLEPQDRLSPHTSHALVAAQLRGESRCRDSGPEAVVDAVAEEIEQLGLVPDREELNHRYGRPSGVSPTLLNLRATR